MWVGWADREARGPCRESPGTYPTPLPALHHLADRSLAPMYYRGAGAAVVVFDLLSRESFEGARSWVRELQRRGDPNVVIALAGNKVRVAGSSAHGFAWTRSSLTRKSAATAPSCHLHTCLPPQADVNERAVDMEEVEAYVTENGLIYMDTSAKTGKNVKEIFVAIAKKLPRSIRQRDADIIQDLRPDAAGEEKDKKASGGCCGGKGSGA